MSAMEGHVGHVSEMFLDKVENGLVCFVHRNCGAGCIHSMPEGNWADIGSPMVIFVMVTGVTEIPDHVHGPVI